ncbi:uncharacterized protein LOC127366891 [Dicentrarchus labrax]|uniref:uncharacterized protein LOC127366891 n=1 Tax=Dicentrarchus labrax TaxID=13489 RepID=UPI0021F671A3|nr:uncharacterized protein LOC127366891 [Dicentrarchus labrax]
MEEAVEAESAGDEYMIMDADKWSELDDIYENGDTPGLDLRRQNGSGGLESGPDSREHKKEELRSEKSGKSAARRALQNTPYPNTAQSRIHPLPERYMTIRRLPVKANRGPGSKQPPRLVFFRYATVCLVLLCILLIGGLLGLSFYYDRLSETHKSITKKVESLQEENKNLAAKNDRLIQILGYIYQVSTTEDYDCSTESDVIIVNDEALKQMEGNSFHLGRRNLTDDGCNMISSWNCTNNFHRNQT